MGLAVEKFFHILEHFTWKPPAGLLKANLQNFWMFGLVPNCASEIKMLKNHPPNLNQTQTTTILSYADNMI